MISGLAWTGRGRITRVDISTGEVEEAAPETTDEPGEEPSSDHGS